MPKTLSHQQIDLFNRDGYLLLEDAFTPEVLTKLQHDFERWKEESRAYTEAYGITIDGLLLEGWSN